jgi:hypothetical protein
MQINTEIFTLHSSRKFLAIVEAIVKKILATSISQKSTRE